MTKRNVHAPSLAQHFEAPVDHVAEFGWVCGYSADAAFLDDALERYTRQTRGQRAWQGRPWLGLLLDRGNAAITPADVPGLVHLRLRPDAKPRFHLLHAKVALLGFRKHDAPSDWTIRLIVSTGNWTRQTVEESLDLAWRVDIRASDLSTADATTLQRVADVAAAWQFFSRLLPLFDDRLLQSRNAGAIALAAEARARLEKRLDACGNERGKPEPRFFDTHDKSIIDQLPTLVQKHAGSQRRNYLAMGSGFFEAPSNDGAFPRVPLAIRETLSAASLLTAAPEVDVFVNPLGCQAIAKTTGDAVKSANLTIRAARTPEAIFGRTSSRALHAKFVFSANGRENSANCTSPWLYLGSGNLTDAGFMRAGPSGGNLEVGVVLTLSDLCWYAKDAKGTDRPAVEHLLPVGWDGVEPTLATLAPGDGFPERTEETLAPPVPWLQWEATTSERLLRSPPGIDPVGPTPAHEVLDVAGHPCERVSTSTWRWSGERPLEVVVRWTPEGKAARLDRVPVIDDCGRVSGSPLPQLDIESARWQLFDFPSAPEPDEGDVDGDDTADAQVAPAAASGANTSSGAGYAIRDMMGFIESIAERQTSLAEIDWIAWCARLEQTLLQTADDPAVGTFKAMGLNPLQPLRLPAFRPAYAESAASDAGKRYEEILDRVEQSWGVVGLAALGDQP